MNSRALLNPARCSSGSSSSSRMAMTASSSSTRAVIARAAPAPATASAAPHHQLTAASLALARRRRCRRSPAAASASSPDGPTSTAPPPPVVAVEGDIVRMHWSCRDAETGAVLECSRGGGAIVATAPGADAGDESEKGEPLTFEVGAGDTQANPIFEAFDAAVRGLAVGERAEIEAEGGAWDPSRLFTVPRQHDEVMRLEGRYKK
jgi:hypothetical protein